MALARFGLGHREYGKTIGHLQALAQENPLVEEVHRLLMSAYAALGDRQSVQRQYQKMESILREELGLDPAAETRELFARLFS